MPVIVLLVALLGVVDGVGGADTWRRPVINAPPPRAVSPLWQDDVDPEFVSGTIPLDTDGQQVHAHEGNILLQDDGLYLWYGTGQKHAVGGDFLSDSVHLYASRDLSSWRYRGRVFLASQIPPLSVPPPYRIQSVKAMYNAIRRQYVLLFGISSMDYSLAAVGFATSVSPFGPFKWELAANPDGLNNLDISVATDDDGSGYLVRSIGANHTAISRLRDDYLGTTGVCSMAPHTGASALFKSGGRWYLLASRHKGWQPTAPLLFVSDGSTLCGAQWTKLPEPAEGHGASTTYDSQPAFVHTHRWSDGSELQVYVGDRWNLDGPGSVENASYVWLPLLPTEGDPPGFKLQWLDRWRLGDYRPIAPT